MILYYYFNTPVALSQIPFAPRVSFDLSSFACALGAPLEENEEDAESLQPKIREHFLI